MSELVVETWVLPGCDAGDSGDSTGVQREARRNEQHRRLSIPDEAGFRDRVTREGGTAECDKQPAVETKVSTRCGSEGLRHGTGLPGKTAWPGNENRVSPGLVQPGLFLRIRRE